MTFTSNRGVYVDLTPGDFSDAAMSRFKTVELKYDGHFSELIGGADGWVLYSRTGKVKKSGTENIGNIHLLGEHIFGTEWARSLPAAEYDSMVVFGAIVDGARQDVEVAIAAAGKVRGVLDWVKTTEVFSVSYAQQLWEDKVQEAGWEGLVFKGPGIIGRMKPIRTVDYVCLGIEISDSESYGGDAKSVVGGLYKDGTLTPITKVGGLTAEQRKDFAENKDVYVGRVFEASGKVIFTSGALRHPNFVRWRDDKNAIDCVHPRTVRRIPLIH